MKDNKQNINFFVTVNYKDEEHEFLVSFNSTAAQLWKIIYTFFRIDQQKYDLYYKNKLITNADTRPLSLVFNKKDTKPILNISDKKEAQAKLNQKTTLTIFTKMSETKFNEIIKDFFHYKNLPFNAVIKKNMNGIFIVNLKDSILCNEFQEYYDSFLRREEEEKNEKKKELFLPLINPDNRDYKKIFKNKPIINYKRIKSDNDNIYSDKKKVLDKIIKNNSKSDLISEKYFLNKKYIIHSSVSKRKIKNVNNSPKSKKEKNVYLGEYKLPYMSADEKYYREKFLDKKKWLNKNGFLPCGNNDNTKDYLPNYLASPYNPPLNHNFRQVSKSKWINKKGFV